MPGKRITFSTATPNDQGGVIPNEVIDFSRFKKNPVLLLQHNWEGAPLGIMTDIKLEGKKYTGVPVFNRITPESQQYADLYDGGWIRACSIGGSSQWKQNAAGQPIIDKQGNRVCESFELYEISIVSLPSNADAVSEENVELAAKFYEAGEIDSVNTSITKLSSQYNPPKMDKTKEELAAEEALKPKTAAEKLASEKAATEEAEKVKLAANSSKTPGTEALPPVLKDILGFMSDTFKSFFAAFAPEKVAALAKPATEIVKNEAPAPKDLPTSEKKDPTQPQPTPTGLEAAKAKAEAAVNKATEMKAKADKSDATEEDKASYKSACMEAASALEALEAEEKKAKEKPAEEKEKSTNAATNKQPVMKTTEQLKTDLKLAAPPEHRVKVGKFNTVPFSQLSSAKNEEGQRILNRVMTSDGGEKDIADYAVVLNSIMQDGHYSALVDKTRIMANVNEAQLKTYQSKPNARSGMGLKDVAKELNSGTVQMMGRDNVVRPITTLSSSDDALATPALAAIEWLSLAIFKLFPSTSWKASIPIFGAQETSNNLGLIWANIAADPSITKGAQPVAPADYTYNDDAVALRLTPYWLQPMRWTPLTMHMLRYDQMSTGWAQAFAKWGAVMDDDMIYTLASTVPAGSIVLSNGEAFNIASAQDPNAFYYGSFTGNLAKPRLQDVIRLEQIFNKQNFDLGSEKPVLVLDPTADALITMDPDTKSLLTRFVNSDSAELLKYKHTSLVQRSRVAVYDPATSQVKDNEGVIPATAVSACLAFLPSQVGIGLGMLDVFMIQDPSAYGYRMSADIRIGTVPLRKNYDGTALLTYGAANV